MTVKFDQAGNAHHQPTLLLNSAGYVHDPMMALLTLHPSRADWYYTIPANPANWKPEIFEGYPDIHTLHHEPWSS